MKSGVAHSDCVSHPAQAGVRDPEIGEVGIHDGILGVDGETANVH